MGYRRSGGHVLPGGGPWKILEHCLAEAHNTTLAARGYRSTSRNKISVGGIKCTCPRSLAILEGQRKKGLEYQSKYLTKRREKFPKVPRWWTGPWKILEECPASGHNTKTRAVKPSDGLRCICPRAKSMVEQHNRESLERVRNYRRTTQPEAPENKRAEINVRTLHPRELRNYKRPDMSKGRCVTQPGALKKFDAAQEAVADTVPATKARNAAKEVCGSCIMQHQCLAWTLQEESPAGSWGGVLGGMDPWEREEAKRRIDGSRDGAVPAAESAVRGAAGSGEHDGRGGQEDGEGGVPEEARSGGEVLRGRAFPHRRTLRASA